MFDRGGGDDGVAALNDEAKFDEIGVGDDLDWNEVEYTMIKGDINVNMLICLTIGAFCNPPTMSSNPKTPMIVWMRLELLILWQHRFSFRI